jgi:hypothetical protein
MASIATDRGRVSPDRNQRCASYRKLDQVREDAFDATFFFAKCPINASIGHQVDFRPKRHMSGYAYQSWRKMQQNHMV